MADTLHYLTYQDMLTYGQVQSGSASVDYPVLQIDCGWAEQMFHELNGHTDFYQQTMVQEQPRNAWVDRNGWMELHAASVAPVTAVTSVSVMVPSWGPPVWQTVNWDVANGILMPQTQAPPNPRAWVVRLYPTNIATGQLASGDVEFKWTYTGGYTTTPDSLKLTLLRMGWWKYKLREAPLGKVAVPPMGITEVIPALPADVREDLGVWTYRLA